jgi:hypothetical protein
VACSASNGPGGGRCTSVSYSSGSGGGHGGSGARGRNGNTLYVAGGGTYDSELEPVDLGSPGGGYSGGARGGGAVKLTVGGVINLNGSISANGNSMSSASYSTAGGGAGGSIWISTSIINGAGTISANGGNGSVYSSTYASGGGGGGRIALYCSQNNLTSSSTVTGGTGFETGEIGTYYELQTVSTPEIVISKTGRQLATTTFGATNFNLGGAFTLESEGNATTTSIKLKQIGSLATSSLSNIKLAYQRSVDATCSSTKPTSGTTLFNTQNSFDEDDAVTFTGSIPLSAGSTTCLYVTYNLTSTYSTSTVGQTVDFEITNPATDVIVTGATTTANTAVNISGQTIVVPVPTAPDPEDPAAPNLDITSLISLHMKDPAKDPTVFYLQNKAIWKMEGGGIPVRLTNPNLQVHSFSLTNLSSYNAEDAVRIQITTSNMDPEEASNFLNVTRTKSTTATVKAWGGAE